MVPYSATIYADGGAPNSLPLAGVQVYVTLQDGTLETLGDAAGNPLNQPAVSNQQGLLSFSVPNPGNFYALEYHYGGRVLRRDSIVIGVPLVDTPLSDFIAGISAAIKGSVALSTGWALVPALWSVMTPTQAQQMRDALATTADTDPVAIIARGVYSQTTDNFGQLINQTLFGGASDGRLATLYASAGAASTLPFSFNLTPATQGTVIIDG